MKSIGIYKLLLKLYPAGYRKAFGAQMLQTFADQLEDLTHSGQTIGFSFWLSTFVDEMKNIFTQYALSLSATNGFLKPSISKFFMTAIFVVPLFATFCTLVVGISLTLPHPHPSGVFAILALVAIWLIFPAILALLSSYILASAVLSVWEELKARIA